MILTPDLRNEYERLFGSCAPRPECEPEIVAATARIHASQTRYESVASPLAIPWRFVAVVHQMECGGRFDRHLHNGDPLTARTVRVPAGRPSEGVAPFTWEQSTTDALQLQGIDKVRDWSLAGVLYRLEGYNGFGYRKRGVRSPYLWSGSQHYLKGKFVADGRFDPEAVSKQLGAAVLWRALVSGGQGA